MALDYALPIPMSSRITNTITDDAWFAVNAPNGIPRSIFKLRITAASDNNVRISFDGVTDHYYLLAGKSADVDFQSNATMLNQKSTLSKGTVFYIRGVGGAGVVYFMGWYQPFNAHDIIT